MLGPLYELPPGGSKPPHQVAGHAHIAHFTHSVQSVLMVVETPSYTTSGVD